MNLHPSTKVLLQDMAARWERHLIDLSGCPQEVSPLGQMDDYAQKILIGALAVALQNTDRDGQIGSNYSWEDVCVGDLQEDQQFVAAMEDLCTASLLSCSGNSE
jgi:hypothetical protein